MPSVFHYTNSAGLLGILKSKCLFATDYRYLNDLSEGTMIRDSVVSIFEAEIAKISPELAKRGFLNARVFDDDQVLRLQAEATYDALARALHKSTPLFVLSFCRHTKQKTIEHGLLSQWRAYTGSAGFAIEFDVDELDQLVKDEAAKFAYSILRSEFVQYQDYEALLEAEKYEGFASEVIRIAFEPQDVSKITGKKEIDAAINHFALSTPFAKNEAFEEEQEYRIVGTRVGKDKIREESTLREKEIKFRTKDGVLVPYIEFFKDSPRKLPIKSSLSVPIHFRRSRRTQS